MKYASVKYEKKNGKHVLYVDMDGNVRKIGFGTKKLAMDVMNQLKVYGKLVEYNMGWHSVVAA